MPKEPTHRPSETGLYIVRLYDGFDNCWTDVTKAISWDEAVTVWNENTENGTKGTHYRDIDYFDIFPSDTVMKFRY